MEKFKRLIRKIITHKRNDKILMVMKGLTMGCIIFITSVLAYALFFEDDTTSNSSSSSEWPSSYEEDYEDAFSESGSGEECNVAGITIHGDIYTYNNSFDSQNLDVVSSEDISYQLEYAQDKENIELIILEIDTYGGIPVAAEEIGHTLQRYVEKPVIALIRSAGLSAGYWVASASDVIFASALSDVGSIGVTQSYLDNSLYNQREGHIYNSLSTGKFKDIGDPNKALTFEEKALIQRDLNIINNIFIKTVARNREISESKVRALADGSSLLGEAALKAGLIDKIGGYYDVLDYIKEEMDIEPVVCW